MVPKINCPPNVDLPPMQVLVVGTGRCGTFHFHNMLKLLFSEYIWSMHEYPPTFAEQVADIYEGEDFTSKRTLGLMRTKWRSLMSQWHREADAPKHRWSDSSAFNVPFIYHWLRQAPETKLIVMIRHPEDFYRSCHALTYNEPTTKNEKVGFVWDRIDHARWKKNYHLYWKECYANIRLQLSWIQREPDLVMFLDPYSEGKYTKRLLRLFDIPETKQHVENATWFCSKRSSNFTINREEWQSAEVPDLEICKSEWLWWEENYAWMAEEEKGI